MKNFGLESLESRRENLSLRFALKAEKHQKFKHWFKPYQKSYVTRQKPTKYTPVYFKHDRFEKSPLS